MTLTRIIAALLCAPLLSGCFVQLKVPAHGEVVTSGLTHYTCPAGEICNFSVTDIYFDETFVARPAPGYRFVGWKQQERGLCGGSTEPCRLKVYPLRDNPGIMAFVDNPEEYFFLEPEFEVVASGPLYNRRYCEILVSVPGRSRPVADLYSSHGLNECADEHWDTVDPELVSLEHAAVEVDLLGPNYWVLDDLVVRGDGASGSLSLGANATYFGDLATRTFATGGLPPIDGSGPYLPRVEKRDTTAHYLAGRRLYMLRAPDNRRYIMLSYSHRVDPALTIDDLKGLGSRLDLPEGWSYSHFIFDYDYTLETQDGRTEVVTDDFGNSYQLVRFLD